MNLNKQKALELRQSGKSYSEIQKILDIPKSTLCSWFKDLNFSKNIKNSNISAAKKIWAHNIIRFNKLRAKKIHENGKKLQLDSSEEIAILSPADLKLIGIALYWAEGYRRAKWTALFCNSDPLMIKLMMKFFREICEVPDNKFRPQVQIHSNVTLEDAENYWAKISNLDRGLFSKPLIQLPKSSKRIRPPDRLPYGTFRVGIADVKILHKIKGWIHGLGLQFSDSADGLPLSGNGE